MDYFYFNIKVEWWSNISLRGFKNREMGEEGGGGGGNDNYVIEPVALIVKFAHS